jgi:predicted nucleic acid-binding protein
VTSHPSPGIVIDTMVIGWLLDHRPNPLAEQYRQRVGTIPALLAFQTVVELRFGAIRAGWGDLRRRRLERSIATVTVVQPDDHMITAWAQLRADCQTHQPCLGRQSS